MVFEIILVAPLIRRDGILNFFLASYYTQDFKFLKGLSKITACISIVLVRKSKAETAPIDLPQRAIFLIFIIFLICLMTDLISYCSQYPIVTYQPSALPHDGKSKVHKAILFLINCPKYYILYNYTFTLMFCCLYYCGDISSRCTILSLMAAKSILKMRAILCPLLKNLYESHLYFKDGNRQALAYRQNKLIFEA